MTPIRIRVRAPALRAAIAVATALALASCDRAQGDRMSAAPADASTGIEAIAAVPLGDLSGAGESALGTAIANPYGASPEAVAQGHALFERMNCAGCHGYGAPGGMGPNLTDTYWRYGGAPVSIFKSIYEGRPQGMPAWNPALPPQEIWKLVAYIQSLGGAYDADQYEASVQGDRVGDVVAPGVRATLTGTAAKSGPTAKGNSTQTTPPSEARPDTGGPAPGAGK